MNLRFATPLGALFVIEAVTPRAALRSTYHHSVFAERGVPRWLAKALLRAFVMQAERDVDVWSNKDFRAQPLLVRGDGAIFPFRRWFAQFHSARHAAAGQEGS